MEIGTKIIALGAGLVGSAIVKDLTREDEYNVLAVDLNQVALDKLNKEPTVSTKKVDLSEKSRVASLVEEFDLVISAVPGFLGSSMLQAIIWAGKNVVDISFFKEDSFQLDDLAKENNGTAVVDCGVTSMARTTGAMPTQLFPASCCGG
jgi:saccharopine dehydrogenase-like NADP-dependent oxidoreductase